MRSYIAITATVLLAFNVQAAPRHLSPGDQTPRVYRASEGSALSLPSQAAPAAQVSEFLRAKGQSVATVDSLVERAQPHHGAPASPTSACRSRSKACGCTTLT